MIKMPDSVPAHDETLYERGRVVEIFEGHVRVRAEQHAACDACGSTTVCFPDSRPAPIIDASCQLDVHVGDLVSLRRPEVAKLGAAFAVFGIPVTTLLVGVVAGLNATGQETQGALAGALAGLLAGLFVVKTINRFVRVRGSMRPIVENVLATTHESA